MYFYEKLIRENVLTFALLHDGSVNAKTRSGTELVPSNYYYLYVTTEDGADKKMRPIFVIFVFRSDIRLRHTYTHPHPHRHHPNHPKAEKVENVMKSGLNGRMPDTNKNVSRKKRQKKMAKTFLISSRRTILSREMS